MITVAVAYRRLKNKLPSNFIISDGFEIKDAYIFSVSDKTGETTGAFPFFSVLKSTGEIGGYNPMQNIPEYMNAIKNNSIDIQELDKPLAKF